MKCVIDAEKVILSGPRERIGKFRNYSIKNGGEITVAWCAIFYKVICARNKVIKQKDADLSAIDLDVVLEVI